MLGGDENAPGKQFITPLATLHKFQGWADKFLTTPNAGVDDRYAVLKLKLLGATTELIYHDFSAESGGQDYGDEWDFSLARTFAGRHKFLFKYADYRSKGFATDTTKWWVQYFIGFGT